MEGEEGGGVDGVGVSTVRKVEMKAFGAQRCRVQKVGVTKVGLLICVVT